MSMRYRSACLLTALLTLVLSFGQHLTAKPPELPVDPRVTCVPNPAKDIMSNVQETATGRLMFGVGVNSDAGVVGNVVLNERNFDLTTNDPEEPNYWIPEVGPIMCGSCAFEEAAVEQVELLPEEEEAAGGRQWFYEGFRRCDKRSSRTIVPEQLDVMPTEESEESEV